MKPLKVVGNGEIVLYKKLDETYDVYKVLNVEPNFNDLDITLQIVGEDGTLGRKKFTTQLIGKKNGGKQRIFRCWLQPKDWVILKETNTGGIVQTIYNSQKPDRSYEVMVDITDTKTQRLFSYSLSEVSNKIELIDEDDEPIQ